MRYSICILPVSSYIMQQSCGIYKLFVYAGFFFKAENISYPCGTDKMLRIVPAEYPVPFTSLFFFVLCG